MSMKYQTFKDLQDLQRCAFLSQMNLLQGDLDTLQNRAPFGELNDAQQREYDALIQAQNNLRLQYEAQQAMTNTISAGWQAKLDQIEGA